ncbi:MAG: hypothetical protein J0H55_03495 [Chitinophagaceae bacterium]|nr:hypothetical protein [Chitinophagaceae bacterium]
MTEFTQDDLLRYLYGETSEKKTAAIRAALRKDAKLRGDFDQLKSLQNKLDQLKASPSKKTIDNILKYAATKQSNVQTH